MSFKFFEEHDPENIKRSLIVLALFCKSAKLYAKAEGLFRRALESFTDVNNNA